MTRDRNTHRLTMDGIATDAIRWKIDRLDEKDPRRAQLLGVLPIFDYDGLDPGSDPCYSAIEALTGSHPAVPRKRFTGNPMMGRGDAQSRNPNLPRQGWASPDSVFEGVIVDFRGCRSLLRRLVRMAETVNQPINVAASARYLIACGMSSQGYDRLKINISHYMGKSDEFQRIRNGYYALRTQLSAD